MAAAIKVKARSEEIFTGDLLSKVGTIFLGRPKSAIPNSAIPKTLDPQGSGTPDTKIRGECRPICENDRFTDLPARRFTAAPSYHPLV